MNSYMTEVVELLAILFYSFGTVNAIVGIVGRIVNMCNKNRK